jgi:oligopeptide transport system substrate-binding protein
MGMLGSSMKGIFLILAACAGLSCGCQSRPSGAASSLSINIKDEPQSLDPRKARQVNSQAIVHMLFDGLMRMGKEGKVETALAHQVEESADHKSYIFHLRDSYWSNGEKVVAYDFAYAWKKVLSPDFPSDIAFLFYPIKNARAAKEGVAPLSEVGITCLDDKTLFVELNEPIPYFLDLVALPMFSPINARLDQENPQWMCEAKDYVGNGPFMVANWEHQRAFQLKKNPLYWDSAAVHLEEIDLESNVSSTGQDLPFLLSP